MEGAPDWVEQLRAQALRRESPWVILEGRQAVEAAIAGWWDISGVLADENSEWDPPEWSGLEVLRQSTEFLEQIVGGELDGGVIGLAKQPDETADVAGLFEELDADAFVVVCPSLREASSVGAITRSAAAMGAHAVLFGSQGASPFERPAVMSSNGAVFRIPVRVADSGQILRCLKAAKFTMFGADDSEEAVDPGEVELEEGRAALVVGSEDDGLGSFWSVACDQLLRIPAASNADSLDASATAAVMLWQLGRP